MISVVLIKRDRSISSLFAATRKRTAPSRNDRRRTPRMHATNLNLAQSFAHRRFSSLTLRDCERTFNLLARDRTPEIPSPRPNFRARRNRRGSDASHLATVIVCSLQRVPRAFQDSVNQVAHAQAEKCYSIMADYHNTRALC